MRPFKNPNPDVEGILTYARNNVSLSRICRVFDVTPQQATNILSANGITPAPSKHAPQKKLTKDSDGNYREPGDKPPTVKESPTAVARRVWGRRLTERDGDYHLDGRRIGFDELMRKTNRQLVSWEMEPVTGNPAWAAVDR